jgi:hypothetical protein
MSYDLQLNDGDITIDTQGDVIVVENYNKLSQDLYRLVLTSRGDNKFDTIEGCGVYDLLGQTMPRELAESVMGKDVYFGIQHMIDQQSAQALVQTLSPYEQIFSLDGIVINRLSIKSLSFNIMLTTVQGSRVAFAYNVL